MLVPYMAFLLSGFVIAAGEPLQAAIQRQRRLSLALAVALTAVLFYLFFDGGDSRFGTPRYSLMQVLLGLESWCWVLAPRWALAKNTWPLTHRS